MDDARARRKAGWRLDARSRSAQHPQLMMCSASSPGLVWAVARVVGPDARGRRRSTTASPRATGRRRCDWTVAILAVGAVQAVVHRAPALRRVRARVARRDRHPHAARRAPPAAALRVPRPGADRSADGATRTPTSSRSTTSCCSIPLTIASTIQMVAVVGHPRAAQPRARVVRARRAAAAQHLGDPLQPPHVSRSASQLQKELSDAVGRRRGERHRRARREGLRRRAAAARAARRPRPTASTTARWTRRGCARTSCRCIDLLPALGLVGILWYGGHQVLDGNLTVGDIVAANLYVLMLIWPLRMIGMLVGQLPRSAAAAGRIDDDARDRSRDRGRAARRAAARRPGRGAVRAA